MEDRSDQDAALNQLDLHIEHAKRATLERELERQSELFELKSRIEYLEDYIEREKVSAEGNGNLIASYRNDVERLTSQVVTLLKELQELRQKHWNENALRVEAETARDAAVRKLDQLKTQTERALNLRTGRKPEDPT